MFTIPKVRKIHKDQLVAAAEYAEFVMETEERPSELKWAAMHHDSDTERKRAWGKLQAASGILQNRIGR